MSPSRLINNVFEEVSVVDKSVGRGTKIKYLKSNSERSEPMQVEPIKKAFRDGNFHKAMSDTIELRKAGRIGPGAYNELYKFAAQTAFPLAKSGTPQPTTATRRRRLQARPASECSETSEGTATGRRGRAREPRLTAVSRSKARASSDQ
jgi:hypothetical protein